MGEIEFRVGGQKIKVNADPHETILDCALRHSVNAPYSCLEGVCGTCRGQIIEGEFDMSPGTALEERDAKAGFVLTCQARIKLGCPRLVVDYDS